MAGSRSDGWLVQGDRVLASVELAGTRTERRRGLSGRTELDGVFVLAARSVHTFGMRFPIDVAYLDAAGVVQRIETLVPNRVSRPCWSARTTVEAPAGSFRSWGISPGDELEVR